MDDHPGSHRRRSSSSPDLQDACRYGRAVRSNPGVTVDVTGFQWQWNFKYPDYRDVSGQPLSYTGEGKNGPEMVLPVGETVRIRLHAQDVIHSWYVPAFFYKRDAIPGRVNEFDVTPVDLGTYGGQCAEFCGLSHSDDVLHGPRRLPGPTSRRGPRRARRRRHATATASGPAAGGGPGRWRTSTSPRQRDRRLRPQDHHRPGRHPPDASSSPTTRRCPTTSRSSRANAPRLSTARSPDQPTGGQTVTFHAARRGRHATTSTADPPPAEGHPRGESDRPAMATTTLPQVRPYALVSARVYEWLTTIDHKKIGVDVRRHGLQVLPDRRHPGARSSARELAVPGLQFLGEATYNQLFGMHAMTMIFLFVMPMTTGLAQLHRAAPDRRRGHGVPAHQRAVVLAGPGRRPADRSCRFLFGGAPGRLDDVRAALHAHARDRRQPADAGPDPGRAPAPSWAPSTS